MAQNTESVQLGGLTIKYSPKYPITDVQQTKLVRSLELARQALEIAIRRLDAVAPIRFGKVEVSEDKIPKRVLEILRFHFFQTRSKVDEYFLLDVTQISNRLRRILNGLLAHVTIADAYATFVGREVEKIDRQTQKGVPLPSKEQFVRQVRRAGDTAMGVVNPKTSFLLALADDPAKERAANDKMLCGTKFKKDVEESISSTDRYDDPTIHDWKPAAEIKPEEYGSIHVNFWHLLNSNSASGDVSEQRVARTIIHEASHKFCNTLDHAYAYDELLYSLLMRAQAMTNADCYAFTAVSLAQDVLYRTDDDMRTAAGVPAGGGWGAAKL